MNTPNRKNLQLLIKSDQGKYMNGLVFLVVFASLIIACAGCTSNPNAGGEVVSSVLMGIGTGLSGL